MKIRCRSCNKKIEVYSYKGKFFIDPCECLLEVNFQKGKKEGYALGEEDGNDIGYSEGHDIGYIEGYDAGKK